MLIINDKEVNEGRESTYRFLAELYKTEITEKMLDGLKKIDPASYAGTPLNEGYSLMRKYLESNPEDPLTELAVDFAKLFLGAGVVQQELSPSPYASVYVNPGRLVMQDARDKVVAVYRENGVDKIKGFDVPEDHIAIELEFMAHLCAETIKASENGDEEKAGRLIGTQKSFIQDHLLNWLPLFSEEINRFALTDFYKGVASLTLAFLNVDREMLADDGGTAL